MTDSPIRDAIVSDSLVTVTDLAAELGITARTLRFYEDKDLISPRRIGANRVYSNRERARMKLILRGKELGFSIREIKDYLGLYDADPRQVTQTRVLLRKIEERRRRLERQREAIDAALEGLDALERDANLILDDAGAQGCRPTKSKSASKPSLGLAADHPELDQSL